MAQDMQLADGSVSREFFSTREVLDGTARRRRKEMEAQGARFIRMVWVDRSIYLPHQGERECERRAKRLQESA